VVQRLRQELLGVHAGEGALPSLAAAARRTNGIDDENVSHKASAPDD
jgi:hypothetical protein